MSAKLRWLAVPLPIAAPPASAEKRAAGSGSAPKRSPRRGSRARPTTSHDDELPRVWIPSLLDSSPLPEPLVSCPRHPDAHPEITAGHPRNGRWQLRAGQRERVIDVAGGDPDSAPKGSRPVAPRSTSTSFRSEPGVRPSGTRPDSRRAGGRLSIRPSTTSSKCKDPREFVRWIHRGDRWRSALWSRY